MEAVMKKKQTPPFGNWDIYNGIPVSGEEVFQNDFDLFKVHEPPMACNYHKRTKVAEKKHLHHQEHRKQRRVCCPVQEQQKRVPKAVDEDLYKIPSEFLNQKPKSSRVVLSDFWKRCLGLSCIS